jgi:hypothetical protein
MTCSFVPVRSQARSRGRSLFVAVQVVDGFGALFKATRRPNYGTMEYVFCFEFITRPRSTHDTVRLVLEATGLQRHGAEVTASGPSVAVAHEHINVLGRSTSPCTV